MHQELIRTPGLCCLTSDLRRSLHFALYAWSRVDLKERDSTLWQQVAAIDVDAVTSVCSGQRGLQPVQLRHAKA